MWICLLVFGVCLCLQVLSVVWGLELEEVEDVLQEFVNKSLLFRDCNQRPYLYFLHDLQLDFLTEQNRSQLTVSTQHCTRRRSSRLSAYLSVCLLILNVCIRSSCRTNNVRV